MADIGRMDHPLEDDEVFLDPAEKETYSFDFPIPDGVRYLQLYTSIACERKKGSKKKIRSPPVTPEGSEPVAKPADGDGDYYRWDLTTLIDLEAELDRAGSVVEKRRASND
jgi:hypothetical protein